MAQTRPVVTKEENTWVIRLKTPSGKTQEYRCSTEGQARHLALVLASGTSAEAAPARP